MFSVRLSHTVPLMVLLLASCHELDVSNPNAPQLMDAFASAQDLEAHVAGAFHGWYRIETGRVAPAGVLSGVAFQHSTPAVCDAPHAEIPRRAVENEESSQCVLSLRAWTGLYDVLTRVADGLRVLEERQDLREELGPQATARLEAYARFVQGLAHGSLALLFDRGAGLDETVERGASGELVDYRTLMDAALGFLQEAAELSEGATWPAIPAEWMSVDVTPNDLARLARSYAARFRANVARTPLEREHLDWTAVLTDAELGIRTDWLVDGGEKWRSTTLQILHHQTRPTQVPYFIIGMADQSGNYQRWLSAHPFERRPILHPSGGGSAEPVLIVTADTRFPQGTTVEAQMAHGGSMFVIPSQEVTGADVTSLWLRPDRGTWRWSFYRYIGAMDYARSVDHRWPAMTVAEVRLLEAEARLRTGDPDGAAGLVNESRILNGLGPTDGTGRNDDCVPRLPDGQCGGLMEMLKWEKRMETQWKGPFLSSWYFDGRGWGDLHAGTFLHLPVPCSELVLLRQGCYTFGGSGVLGTAPGSGYEWPHEMLGIG